MLKAELYRRMPCRNARLRASVPDSSPHKGSGGCSRVGNTTPPDMQHMPFGSSLNRRHTIFDRHPREARCTLKSQSLTFENSFFVLANINLLALCAEFFVHTDHHFRKDYSHPTLSTKRLVHLCHRLHVEKGISAVCNSCVKLSKPLCTPFTVCWYTIWPRDMEMDREPHHSGKKWDVV